MPRTPHIMRGRRTLLLLAEESDRCLPFFANPDR